MALENGQFISDLNPQYPAHTDPLSEGDGHITLIKKVLKGTFPGFTSTSGVNGDGAVNSTQAQIDKVAGDYAKAIVGLYGSNGVRWAYGLDGSAETGSNAGSNLNLNAYADDGSTVLSTPFVVTRSSGLVTVNNNLTVQSQLSVTGTMSVSGSAALPTVTGACNFDTTPTVNGAAVIAGQVSSTQLASGARRFVLMYVMGDNVNPLQTGIRQSLMLPYACTLTSIGVASGGSTFELIQYNTANPNGGTWYGPTTLGGSGTWYLAAGTTLDCLITAASGNRFNMGIYGYWNN